MPKRGAANVNSKSVNSNKNDDINTKKRPRMEFAEDSGVLLSSDDITEDLIGDRPIKQEIEDDVNTESLQLSCESVLFSSDYSVEPVQSSKKTPAKPVPASKQPTRPVKTPSATNNSNSRINKVNVDTSKTNVTAIMLKSVAPVSRTAKGKDAGVGTSAAASLLAQHHVQSPASTPQVLTTVLSRSSSKEGGVDQGYYVCEDNSELKRLLVESNNIKHKLTQQLNTQRKTTATLQTKLEMLEAVVVELKERLESVDPEGYSQLINGNLQSFYSQLGM